MTTITEQRILVKAGKTERKGEQIYKDYGMCIVTIDNQPFMTLSSPYLKSGIPESEETEPILQLVPIIKDNSGLRTEQASGFYPF